MSSTSNSAISVDSMGRPLTWVALVVLTASVIRWAAFSGVLGADDVSIAAYSLHLLENGPWLPVDHYQGRVGMIYPQALLYRLFGVGEWQTSILPMTASIASVVIAFLIGRRLVDNRTGLLAALVVAAFPLSVATSSVLLPDPILAALLGLTFYLSLVALGTPRYTRWSVAAGLVWGLAYLVKVEAGLLGVPLFVLLLIHPDRWRPLLWVYAAAALVVFLESLVYWLAGGSVLHRLVTASAASHSIVGLQGEFSARQWWIYPKAWFITAYRFGLHYYVLVAAILWALTLRQRRLLALVVWVVVFLAWMQFGGNPFSEHYIQKTHLLRYCEVVSIPMAVLVGAFVTAVRKWSTALNWVLTGLITVVGLFFINFNTLSVERELATKRALDYAREHDLFPLYTDRISEAIASIYMHSDPRVADVLSLQKHSFSTGVTSMLDLEGKTGYLLINRRLVDYSWKRYGVEKLTSDGGLQAIADDVLYRVDNPGNGLAYRQARVMGAAAEVIPIAFIRDKIAKTASELLEGDDAVIVRISGTRIDVGRSP